MPYFACMEGGWLMTDGPLDICKILMMDGPVPVPTPLPFINMATWMMAIGVPIALFSCMPACNMISMIELSEDDEAGFLGGLISETIMEMVMIEDGSPVLFLDAMPAADFGISMSTHNLENAEGDYDEAPSQTVVTGT